MSRQRRDRPDSPSCVEKNDARDSQIIPNQRQCVLSEGGTMLSLKTMTESKLKVLKRQVEAAIHAKVAERRCEIESELSKLSLLDGGERRKVVRAVARGTVAVKVGKKPEASTLNQPRKVRNTRKAANSAETGFSPPVIADHIEPLRIETSAVALIEAPVPLIEANAVSANLSVAA